MPCSKSGRGINLAGLMVWNDELNVHIRKGHWRGRRSGRWVYNLANPRSLRLIVETIKAHV